MLDLRHNRFKDVPPVVYNLPALQTLYLRFNRIKVVHANIGNLKVRKIVSVSLSIHNALALYSLMMCTCMYMHVHMLPHGHSHMHTHTHTHTHVIYLIDKINLSGYTAVGNCIILLCIHIIDLMTHYTIVLLCTLVSF